MDNARHLALEILEQINLKKLYSQAALATQLQDSDLQSNDKSLVTELVSGTLRRQGTLDWLINLNSTQPIGKIPNRELNILRIALYQILYVSNIPDYAAIDEAAKQARKNYHPGMVSFTNGILRNIARNKESIPWPDRVKDPVEYLSIFYSHPKWMVEKFIDDFGEIDAEKLLASNNDRPKIFLRTNRLKNDRSAIIQKLNESGINTATPRFIEESILIDRGPYPDKLIRSGLVSAQNESSMIVSRVLAPKTGETVIDMCSGPGGKTAHLAELMDNVGKIVAIDINQKRLSQVEDNCRRLGITIAEMVLGDSSTHLDLPKADKILVDAPCSGLGVLSRRPDLRWRRSTTDIENIAKIQTSILNNAPNYLKPGGSIVYSVCTITPEETTKVIDKFLMLNRDRKLLGVDKGEIFEGAKGSVDQLQILPDRYGMDGMFIAKFD